MSGLLNQVVSMGKAALQRMSSPTDPNLVKPVLPADLVKLPTVQREGCLQLIGPRPNAATASGSNTSSNNGANVPIVAYEVVAHTEKGQSFSLFRGADLPSTQSRFQALRNSLPLLSEADPASPFVSTQSGLQQMCDAVRGNPTRSPLHLAIQLDIRTVLTYPALEQYLNSQDHEGVTPLMLAVQKENLYMCKFLVGKKVALDLTDAKGDNVFHFAALKSKEIVEALGDAIPAPILNSKNSNGDTPLHVACKNDRPDCVQALLCAGADVNVTGTLDEDLPIHTALKSSSARCVKEIIEMYPKQLQTKDIKAGGTPLHWAKSKEIVSALIEHGCAVDARNFNKKTALHLAVENERLECAVAFASHGAALDLPDGDGNTALHLAAAKGAVTIVRALLAFDADTSLKNGAGLTPWEVAEKKANETGMMDFKDREGVLYSLFAVGAFGSYYPSENETHDKEFRKIIKAQTAQQRRARALLDEMLARAAIKNKTSGGGAPSSGSSSPRGNGARLLTLDGGGVKGMVLARMLLSMEQILTTPTVHCFDWISGTSTGGMLALALASGKTPKECLFIYFKLKDKVFVDSRPYDTKPLEELLLQEYGATTKLFDIKEPKLVITATMADRSPPDLHLFRNYQSPQEMLGIADFDHPELTSPSHHYCASEQLVWKTARATGAAPSFFRPEGKYVDGGILANNPSLVLLTEVAEYNAALKAVDRAEEVVVPSVLISLGTGMPPIKKTKVVDIFRPDSAQDTLKLFLNWDGMGKLMLESVVDADGKVVDQSRAWCLSTGTSFHRFTPHLINDVELDEKDDKILVDLLWTTMAHIHSRRQEVLALKPLLVP